MGKTVIVIPTYNEKENIERTVTEVFVYMPSCRVLVVDDNSPDGTAGIVESLMRHEPRLSLLRRQGKEGLGKAYLHAFEVLRGESEVEFIGMMDADLSHHPEYFPVMVRALNAGADVAIGSRYMNGGRTENCKLWRRIVSRGANLYTRIITQIPVHDVTNGFNLIRTRALRAVNLSHIDSSASAFLIELKYLLWKSGARLVEIPIVFKNRTGGESKISNRIFGEGLIAPWKMIFKK